MSETEELMSGRFRCNSCQNGRVYRREDVSGNAFREGTELLAVREVERHEAAQLPEPFGEWN